MTIESFEREKARILAAIASIRNPASGLVPWEEPLPKNTAALQRYFDVLREVWQAGLPNDEVPDVVGDMAQRLTSYVLEVHRDQVRAHASKMFRCLENRITDCLRSGVVDSSHLVLTSSFGDVAILSERANSAAGRVSSLPADHLVRSLLPDDDFYRINGTAHLVLGPTLQSQPRSWYPIPYARDLTSKWRRVQRREEQQKALLAQHQERIAREAREVREATPEGGLLRRLRQLEEKVAK